MYIKLLGAFAIAFSTLVSAATSYVIEVSHNDELFIINGEKFKAKTYCFNMNEGDRVIFISGRPTGVCVSAELLNLRTQRVCRVWCE
jgi:ribosomal protein S17